MREPNQIARRRTPQLGTPTLDVLRVASALVLRADTFYTFDGTQGKLATAEDSLARRGFRAASWQSCHESALLGSNDRLPHVHAPARSHSLAARVCRWSIPFWRAWLLRYEPGAPKTGKFFHILDQCFVHEKGQVFSLSPYRGKPFCFNKIE